MAESQLNQVPTVFEILQNGGKITPDNLLRVGEILLDESLTNERQRLVGTGMVKANDYELALLESAKLAIEAAEKDMLAILSAEPIEKDGILDSRYGVNAHLARAEKSDNTTIGESACAVAEVATRIVVLANANRDKVDLAEAGFGVSKAMKLIAYMHGEESLTEDGASGLYYGLIHDFAEIARDSGVKEGDKTAYISAIGHDIRAGIAYADSQEYTSQLVESHLAKVDRVYQILIDQSILVDGLENDFTLIDIIAEIKANPEKSERNILLKSSLVTEENYDHALLVQARQIADAAVADMATLLNADRLHGAEYDSLSWGGNKGVNSANAKPTIVEAAQAAADVAKTIIILANRNRTNPNLNAQDANEALIAAAGLARYFDSKHSFEDASVDLLVSKAFNGLKTVLNACDVPNGLAADYVSARQSEVEKGLGVKETTRTAEPAIA